MTRPTRRRVLYQSKTSSIVTSWCHRPLDFCLIYALLNFSFSNIYMEHLLYFPSFSYLFKLTPVESKKATAIFEGTNGRGTI